jgi:hypothetical protein
MWGWIKHVLGIAAGVIDETIRTWVGDLISGVFGFLHTVFGFVGHAWLDLFNAARWMYAGVLHLGIETYATLYHALRVVIPDVIRWASRFIHDVWTYAIDVFRWTIRQFDWVKHWVLALWDDLRRWVIHDIWDPIWHTLYPVWHWVVNEGKALWNLVTHPALLVDWIWEHLLVKIEREAWNAGRLLGRFFISLVFHNLKTFFVLLEDIIDAIL